MTTDGRPDITTAAVHAGEPRLGGAVGMPIFQTSTFLYEGTDDYHAGRYVRLSNTPNHDVLHDKLAALEGGEAALVTASGMAAISTAMLTALGAGDHVLVLDCPYGGTRGLVTEVLPGLGIEHSFIDGDDPADWEAKRRPTTRAIYVESITNPLMTVPDLAGAVEFARRHGMVSMIDNTFTSPVNFRAAAFGFDLSLHSATKYLAGHNDVAAGAIVGRRDLVDRAHRLLNHLGGSLDPHACFLLHRGIKTLPLRVRRQCESALAIARYLDDNASVARVNYPGLASCSGHDRAATLFEAFGGMLSFELAGGVEAAERLLAAVTIPIVAVSLGGIESLLIRPSVTAYASVPPEERRRLGVRDELVRMSVGIEDPSELIADLGRALDAVAAPALR